MMKFLKTTLFGAALALSAGTTFAASTTGLGATSTGDFIINVTLQDLVQISALNDLNLGTYTGTLDLSGTETFCVYRNGTGLYDVTITGDSDGAGGAGNLMYVTSGVNTMPYSITYNGTAVDNTDIAGATNTLTAQAGDGTQLDCGLVDNSTVVVTILEADLQGAPTGVYSGTLTMLVAPN